MSEESDEGEMEKKTWNKTKSGFPSQGQRNGGGRETVPKGRGQWRKDRNRGQDHLNWRPLDQDYQRQFKNSCGRREGSNGTPPQRHGGMPDKRPQPRSCFPQKKTPKTLELDLAATTAVAGGNRSKKYGTSLNHLLNFKYAPREQTVVHRLKFGRKCLSTFNKEQFLQANCQFVVSDSGDYTVYAVDPDVLVDWSLVEQVRIYSHGVPSCPICLYPPTAAKITRCGHIYCWACMLHYQSLSDKSWHKCPICYEAIHKKDLKSVVAMANHQFAVGEQITMRLMKRSKESVLALPKSQWLERELKPFRLNDPVDTHHSKLLLASPEEVLEQIISIEEKALVEQMKQAKTEQSEEQCFVELALQELQDRKKQLLGTKQIEEELKEEIKSNKEKLSEVHQDTNEKEGNWRIHPSGVVEVAGEYEAAFSDHEEDESSCLVDQKVKSNHSLDDEHQYSSSVSDTDQSVIIPEAVGTGSSIQDVYGSAESNTSGSEVGEENHCDGKMHSPTSSTQNSTHYYFYQADDGQNIFLHPVNARCLIKEYGGLEFCPETITAHIVEIEAFTQTEELRRRYRYLSHLPLTCEFVICELDLRPPVITKQTLECFRDIIHQRKKQRQKKVRSEKRWEKKIEANNASTNGYPIPTRSNRQRTESLDLESEQEFPSQGSNMAVSPTCSTSPVPLLQLAADGIVRDENYGMVTEVEGRAASPSDQGASVGWPPSFAQALRAGKAAEFAKITKKTVTEPALSFVKVVPSTSDDEATEDHVPVPTFQSAFSEALAASWCNTKVKNSKQQNDDQSHAEDTGKKQKKAKKKQLLFTTGNFMKYN